jgi:hypothetical protein
MMIDEKILENELLNLPDGWIILLETKAEKSFETGLTATQILTKHDYQGIIISASRPYKNLVTIYTQKKISLNKLVIIDCISKSQDADIPAENAIFLENVSALTNISISVNELINQIQGKKFVLLDSISTMLIYNHPQIFARFIHNILTKIRLKGISGLLLSLDADIDKNVKAEIMQLCDKTIKI